MLIYARFLFHAVPDAVEADIVRQASGLLLLRGGVFAAEFRTLDDEPLAKTMPVHYRRYVDPDRFCAGLEASGLQIVERCEGQGMAVYGDEDAYVARVLARS